MSLTNKRILVKKGVISVYTDELKLNKIESINISRGILGTIFSYGDIIFSGTGTNKVTFKSVDNPTFIKNKIEDIFEIYKKNITTESK
ncbi:MAG: PH domain-containing protein [Elusimicrobiota bacterium]|nr:PH domain-containing protein [Elusimicrobiota bacterium]